MEVLASGDDVEAHDRELVLLRVRSSLRRRRRGPNVGTLRNYESDFTIARRFCERRKVASLPMTIETLLDYVTYLSRTQSERTHRVRSARTIARHVAAIAYYHDRAGVPSPTRDTGARSQLRPVLAVEPQKAPRPRRNVAPVAGAQVRGGASGVRAARDAALAVLLAERSMRLRDLVELRVSDVERTAHGIRLRVAASSECAGPARAIVIPCTERNGHRDHELGEGAGCAACIVRRYVQYLPDRNGRLFRACDRWGNLSSAPMHVGSIAGIIERAGLSRTATPSSPDVSSARLPGF